MADDGGEWDVPGVPRPAVPARPGAATAAVLEAVDLLALEPDTVPAASPLGQQQDPVIPGGEGTQRQLGRGIYLI